MTKTIYIALYTTQPMIGDFDVIKETEKAYKIKNTQNKTMWFPKKGLKNIDDVRNQYTVSAWFKNKLEDWQISFLQS